MVSGKAFCVIAIPHDKLQHPVQVRDNYWTTVYKQNILYYYYDTKMTPFMSVGKKIDPILPQYIEVKLTNTMDVIIKNFGSYTYTKYNVQRIISISGYMKI